jgi:hypothetical protein
LNNFFLVLLELGFHNSYNKACFLLSIRLVKINLKGVLVAFANFNNLPLPTIQTSISAALLADMVYVS